MKIRYMITALFAAGAFAIPAHSLHAQDTSSTKPGGVNRIARNVSKTVKKAGRDTKAEVHRDASKTHRVLKKAGNDTKTAAGNATGIHKVGGSVGAAARDVSHASKTAGRKAKKSVKKMSKSAHDSLTSMGKGVKQEVKKPPM